MRRETIRKTIELKGKLVLRRKCWGGNKKKGLRNYGFDGVGVQKHMLCCNPIVKHDDDDDATFLFFAFLFLVHLVNFWPTNQQCQVIKLQTFHQANQCLFNPFHV